MVDLSGSTAYLYDSRDRLTNRVETWTAGPSVMLKYRYDGNGNLTNLWSSSSNGVTNVYQYDALNRLTNVIGPTSSLSQYGYDGVGNLQWLRYGNGVTNLYQYDSLNRLTNCVWYTNGVAVASFYYQLASAGSRTNLTETVNSTGRTYQWQYDPLYRLTNENVSASPAGSLGYAYDPVGNRTSRAGTLGLLTAQSFAYGTNDWVKTNAYDSNGNTLWATNGTPVGPYNYDVENHLTNFGSAYFSYNGDGLRVKKVVSGTTNYYLLDDRNPTGYAQALEEWTSTGTPTLSKVYNYGLALISQRNAVAPLSTNYFVFDGHGSTRMLTDSSGIAQNAFAFDAFGNLIASNATPATAYLYCGEQFDSDLGLYYLRARYFNPQTGRFWTMDSFEGNQQDPLSLHKYLYAADNAVNMVDPLGKWATFLHKMAIKDDLKGLLSDEDISILCEMQDEVDGKANQHAKDSFMHAMRDGEHKQTPDAAKQLANNRIKGLLTDARASEAKGGKGNHQDAMRQLGRAMHTLQDSTSPAHHGFQPWYDYPGATANPCEWIHGAKESIYPGTWSWLGTATLGAYNYFTGSSQMPADFFARLGADSIGDEFLHKFHIPYDSLQGFNINLSISDIAGFAF